MWTEFSYLVGLTVFRHLFEVDEEVLEGLVVVLGQLVDLERGEQVLVL